MVVVVGSTFIYSRTIHYFGLNRGGKNVPPLPLFVSSSSSVPSKDPGEGRDQEKQIFKFQYLFEDRQLTRYFGS